LTKRPAAITATAWCCKRFEENVAVLLAAVDGSGINIRLSGGQKANLEKLLPAAVLWSRAALINKRCPHCRTVVDEGRRDALERLLIVAKDQF
jgi:hypothetical protein